MRHDKIETTRRYYVRLDRERALAAARRALNAPAVRTAWRGGSPGRAHPAGSIPTCVHYDRSLSPGLALSRIPSREGV